MPAQLQNQSMGKVVLLQPIWTGSETDAFTLDEEGAFTRLRRVYETPLSMVLEARP